MSTGTDVCERVDADGTLREQYHHHAKDDWGWRYGGPPVATKCGITKKPSASAPDECCPMCGVAIKAEGLDCDGVGRHRRSG